MDINQSGRTRLSIITMLLGIITGILFMECSSPPIQQNTVIPTPVVVESYPTQETSLIQEEVDDAPLLDSKETYRQLRVNELISLWDMMFDDDKASSDDPRRNNFQEYATYLVEAIETYENQATDIGGQLPESEDTHILLGVMVKKESSVVSDIIGKLGEVGLLQIHGQALNGYEPGLVKENPKLGLLLGVRWFAYQTSLCKSDRVPADIEPWRLDDWAGPLSVYAGGPKAINKKTGKCYHYKVATNRIKLAKFYKVRIKALGVNNK